MNNKSYLQLKTSSITNIPLQTYDEFVFIVNGKKFKTSRIISDLLSPKICQLHLNDPTFNQYAINTKYKGDFSQFLNLTNFKRQEYSDDDLEFITEIIEILDNDSIKFTYQEKNTEITNENVFKRLKKHQKHPRFFSAKINDEIDFISSHFYELFENEDKYTELQSLELNIIEQIINNTKLKLTEEDQLLKVVNNLYWADSKYSILYEYVDFKTAGTSAINEFINIFDINDINIKTWKTLSKRLGQEIKPIQNIKKKEKKRYIKSRQKENSNKYALDDPFTSTKDNKNNMQKNLIDPFSHLKNNKDDPFAPIQRTESSDDSDGPFAVPNNISSRNNANTEIDPFASPPKRIEDPFAPPARHYEDPFASPTKHFKMDPFA